MRKGNVVGPSRRGMSLLLSPTLRRLVTASLLRSWLGFSAVTVLAWAAFLDIDRDNPLRSDDPYIVGFFCGGFAAAMGIVYSIAEKACATRVRASILYAAVVVLWTMLFVALSAQAKEGAELGRFLAFAHLVSGIVSWPLFAYRIPRSMVAAISAGGLAILIMYGIVAVHGIDECNRMNSRRAIAFCAAVVSEAPERADAVVGVAGQRALLISGGASSLPCRGFEMSSEQRYVDSQNGSWQLCSIQRAILRSDAGRDHIAQARWLTAFGGCRESVAESQVTAARDFHEWLPYEVGQPIPDQKIPERVRALVEIRHG